MSCPELPRASRSYQELPEAQKILKLLRFAQSYPDLPRASKFAKNYQDLVYLPRATKNCPELPGADQV